MEPIPELWSGDVCWLPRLETTVETSQDTHSESRLSSIDISSGSIVSEYCVLTLSKLLLLYMRLSRADIAEWSRMSIPELWGMSSAHQRRRLIKRDSDLDAPLRLQQFFYRTPNKRELVSEEYWIT